VTYFFLSVLNHELVVKGTTRVNKSYIEWGHFECKWPYNSFFRFSWSSIRKYWIPSFEGMTSLFYEWVESRVGREGNDSG